MNNYNRVRIIITLCIICMIFSILPSFSDSQKHVLIINSYHRGLSWTDDATNAEIKTIKGEFSSDIKFYVEYMDWKEHPTSEMLELFREQMSYKYKATKIDLIVANDDAALRFALENQNSIFQDIPIIFQGISESSYNAFITDRCNIAGVIETVDIKTTLEVAHMVNPTMTTFYIIHDQTESGKDMGATAAKQICELYPELEVVIVTDRTIDEITEFVGTLTKSDSILMTAYYTDINGNNINFEDMIEKVSRSTPAAVFSLYEFALGTGALGGNLLSGQLMGERTGELAVEVLKGVKADSLPLVRDGIHISAIDYEAAEKFDIKLNNLSNDIAIINKPTSFYELYKSYILTSLFLITVMGIFLISLSYYLRKTIKLKNELAIKNFEQMRLYDDLYASEEQLKYSAFHDQLTGFANKSALEADISKDSGYDLTKYGILLIDIDHFKRINDTLGHHFGDKYIQAVGNLIKNIVENDNVLLRKCKIYRINGDEFVIYHRLTQISEIEQLANHLIQELNDVIQVAYSNFSNSVSIGYAVHPIDGDTLESLLTKTDLAMYKAKEEGRGRAKRYENSMFERVVWRLEREDALKFALERGELTLMYQPLVDCNDKNIVGFEALLRWTHPTLGVISPHEFIPIAEETQLIMPIGNWVIDEALKYLVTMQKEFDKSYHMAVNVSVLQLLQEDFEKVVSDALIKYNVKPEDFIIELTESVLMQTIEATTAKLARLQKLGIKIALDDFGTGYSSLSYLKSLPIDILKIDKSFIDALDDSKEQENLVKVIVMMGQKLDMKLVAEGVELETQWESLKALQCDFMQGYYFSKPLTPDQCIQLMASQN